MSTSKPVSHPTRERSTSTPAAAAGRRSPIPSSSPIRRLPEKSAAAAPHHLKPTLTAANAATKSPVNAAKSSPSTAALKRQPVKKPIEKAPSPSPHTGRTLSSTPAMTRTNRERSPKPASPSPMPRAYYQRTSLIPLVKGQKSPAVVTSSTSTAKAAKPGTYTRSKSMEKSKVIATLSGFVDTSSTSDSEATVAKAELKTAKEDENEILACVDANHSPKNPEEDQEHGDVVSLVHEQQQEVNISDIVVDRDQQQQEEEKQSEALVTENEEVQEEEGAKEEDAEEKFEEEAKEEREETMPVDESPKRPMTDLAAKEPRPVEAAPPRGVAAAAKKEAQRSNDVIEEAKSKFLEKRKNKVLALVGAFETVMALQEPEVQQVHPQKKGEEAEEETTITTSEPNEPSEATEPTPSQSMEPTESTETSETAD